LDRRPRWPVGHVRQLPGLAAHHDGGRRGRGRRWRRRLGTLMKLAACGLARPTAPSRTRPNSDSLVLQQGQTVMNPSRSQSSLSAGLRACVLSLLFLFISLHAATASAAGAEPARTVVAATAAPLFAE